MAAYMLFIMKPMPVMVVLIGKNALYATQQPA